MKTSSSSPKKPPEVALQHGTLAQQQQQQATIITTTIPPDNNTMQHRHNNTNHQSAAPTESNQRPLESATAELSTFRVQRKRGRRRAQTVPDQPNGLDRVFIWDIEGSLVRSDTIMGGSQDLIIEPSVLTSVRDKLSGLAKRFKELTLTFCEGHLFLGDLESVDQMHIEDVHSGETDTPAVASVPLDRSQPHPHPDNHRNHQQSQQSQQPQQSQQSQQQHHHHHHQLEADLNNQQDQHQHQQLQQLQQHHQQHTTNESNLQQQQQSPQLASYQLQAIENVTVDSSLVEPSAYATNNAYNSLSETNIDGVQGNNTFHSQLDGQLDSYSLGQAPAVNIGGQDSQQWLSTDLQQQPAVAIHHQHSGHLHMATSYGHHNPYHQMSSHMLDQSVEQPQHQQLSHFHSDHNQNNHLYIQQMGIQHQQQQHHQHLSQQHHHHHHHHHQIHHHQNSQHQQHHIVHQQQQQQQNQEPLAIDQQPLDRSHPHLHPDNHRYHQQSQQQHQHHQLEADLNNQQDQHHHHQQHSQLQQLQHHQQHTTSEPNLQQQQQQPPQLANYQLQVMENVTVDSSLVEQPSYTANSAYNSLSETNIESVQGNNTFHSQLDSGQLDSYSLGQAPAVNIGSQDSQQWLTNDSQQQPAVAIHHQHSGHLHMATSYGHHNPYHQMSSHMLDQSIEPPQHQQHSHFHADHNQNNHLYRQQIGIQNHHHHQQHQATHQHQHHLLHHEQHHHQIHHHQNPQHQQHHIVHQQQNQESLTIDQQPPDRSHPHLHLDSQRYHHHHHHHQQQQQQQQQQHHHHHHHQLAIGATSTITSAVTIAASAVTTASTATTTATTTTTTTNSTAAINLRAAINNHHKQISHRLSLKFHKIKAIYNLNRGGTICGDIFDSACKSNGNNNGTSNGDDGQSNNVESNSNNNNSNNNQKPQQSLDLKNDLQQILCEIDHYTLDWRRRAIDCLRLISESPNCTNIIITKLPLVVALGHLVCLGLSQYFEVDQVYSANRSNKEACLKRIKKRFGTSNRCSYIIVGDRDDTNMAKRLDLPSWTTSKSDGHRQLLQLYTALKEGYLM